MSGPTDSVVDVIRSIGEIVSAEQAIAVDDAHYEVVRSASSVDRRSKLTLVEGPELALTPALAPAELVASSVVIGQSFHPQKRPAFSRAAARAGAVLCWTALSGSTLALVIAAFLKY